MPEQNSECNGRLDVCCEIEKLRQECGMHFRTLFILLLKLIEARVTVGMNG
jgi:hypothetical protein